MENDVKVAAIGLLLIIVGLFLMQHAELHGVSSAAWGVVTEVHIEYPYIEFGMVLLFAGILTFAIALTMHKD